MIQVHELDGKNVGRLKNLYARFSTRAALDYGWTSSAIDFETLSFAINKNLMSGYFLTLSDPQSEPIGLMLYRLEEHRSLELNLVYLEQTPSKAAMDVLMPRFVQDACKIPDWDVISYALLGLQADYVMTLPWYGFVPVGQTIFKFDMLDVLAVQILKKQTFSLLPAEYRIIPWEKGHSKALADCIQDAFHQAVDALWDPRFRTVQGTGNVVSLIESGLMGALVPNCTRLAFRGNELVGFCFVIESSNIAANVPLVGTHHSTKGLGLGSQMLWASTNSLIDEALAKKSNLFSLDATTDTENFAALRMYRRLGFREEQSYPHVYLTREKAMRYRPGKWC